MRRTKSVSRLQSTEEGFRFSIEIDLSDSIGVLARCCPFESAWSFH